jgi:hypothetical protein
LNEIDNLLIIKEYGAGQAILAVALTVCWLLKSITTAEDSLAYGL